MNTTFDANYDTNVFIHNLSPVGLATKLMRQAHARMKEAFGAAYCSLHVRYTNVAAFHLYSKTLGYRIDDIEKGSFILKHLIHKYLIIYKHSLYTAD